MNAISRGCPPDSAQLILSRAQVEALRSALAGRLLEQVGRFPPVELLVTNVPNKR